MKISITEIDKKYQDNISAMQRMVEQQAAAKRDAERLNQEAEAAACGGNVEEFTNLKRKAQEASDLAYVLEKQIEKINSGAIFTDEEINAAWESCASEHNRQLNAKLKKFREAKTELLRQYAEMVTLQRETCAVRERLAGYIGIKKEPAAPDYGLERRFPFDAIPCKARSDAGTINVPGANIADPDAAYYLSSLNKTGETLYRDPEAQQIVEVIGFRHAR